MITQESKEKNGNAFCLQEKYSPKSHCFGCGPCNPNGLRIRSFVHGKDVVAEWTPALWHEAFPGVLNGGVIGALLDCHSNWTAAWHLLLQTPQVKAPPCTVTADYAIRLLSPTSSREKVFLFARPVQVLTERVVVEAELHSGGRCCATCRGTFVAVKEDHPAYHRW